MSRVHQKRKISPYFLSRLEMVSNTSFETPPIEITIGIIHGVQNSNIIIDILEKR